MGGFSLRVVTLALAVTSTAAIGQSTSYSSVDAAAGALVQIGYYASAKKDCAPNPLPTIDVATPPKHGVLTIRNGMVTTNKVANCPNLKLPAQVVFYQGQTGYAGPDQIVFAVTNPAGEVNIYSFSITVKEGPPAKTPQGSLL
jgi:hypothetical protein